MTTSPDRKLLIVSIAALGHDFLKTHAEKVLPATSLLRNTKSLLPSFPSVTCTSQATFRTAADVQSHDMVMNGFYDRRWRKVLFWEQSANLVSGERIWSEYRRRGKKVGIFFWQQAMGEDADYVLTPAPIHKHHGGMIMDCYSQPGGLYPRLKKKFGGISLGRYWGPFSHAKVGNWIAQATADVMANEAPDLQLLYLPSLDYALQRQGSESPAAAQALQILDGQLEILRRAAREHNYDLLFWGDYAIANCRGPAIMPNHLLREAGLFSVRDISGMLYPDFHTSRAFAVCDHEVAQVYIRDPHDLPAVRACLAAVPGLDIVDNTARKAAGELVSPNAGELQLVAPPDTWLAYYWWDNPLQAPEYARHIDIHNKPGFDPCELFLSGFPPGITQDTTRIRGSHGRDGRPAAWGGTLDLAGSVNTLTDLASAVRNHLHHQ